MVSLGIGIGAGLVSALLFGVVITGSPLALLLVFIAALPILIASLGWKHWAGLAGAAAGSLAVAIAVNAAAGVMFALGWALPAWGLAYLALLGRQGPDGTTEWYPLGRLLLWVVAVSALLALASVLAIGGGSLADYQANAETALALLFREAAPSGEALDERGREAFGVIIASMPFLLAWNVALILTANLWLAGRIVRISERLPRPWPFLPDAALPRAALAVWALAVAAMLLPDGPSIVGSIFAGALFGGFCLQGLAFLHQKTRGRAHRAVMLAGIYVLIFITQGVALLLIGILGLADTAFALRNRFDPGTAGPPSP